MTVENQSNKKRFQGDGATDQVTFSFRALSADDIKVYVYPDDLSFTDIEDYLLTGGGVDYDIELDADGEGGTVTFTVAPAADEIGLLINQLGLTQTADLPVEGNFNETSVETALDRSVMQNIQQQEQINRGLSLRKEDPLAVDGFEGIFIEAVPAADRAGRILEFNSTGDGVVAGVETSVLTEDLAVVAANIDEIAAAAALLEGAIEDQIVNGEVVKAPSQNAVFDALALKQAADPLLTSLSALGTGANKVPVITAADTAAEVSLAASQLLGRGSSGNVTAIALGTGITMSGDTLSVSGASDVQTFTGSGTWTKPAGASANSLVIVQAWAGGGSGGSGTAGNAAGGGGGGSCHIVHLLASQCGSTETVTIGAGGIAVATNNQGNVGGNTTFGTLVTAYGGGGGDFSGSSGGGGGGGGVMSAGVSGSKVGGNPQGGSAGSSSAGGQSYAGGGGGGDSQAALGYNGGLSYFGGGGGGGSSQDAVNTNGAGGASYFGGGGGGAAAEDSSPGPGAGGTSIYGGNGGAGAFDANAATAGSVPGGGGGGAETGTSGAGGAGKMIVRTIY